MLPRAAISSASGSTKPSVFIKAASAKGQSPLVSPTKYPTKVLCTQTFQPITTTTVTKTGQASRVTASQSTTTSIVVVSRTTTTTSIPPGITSTVTTGTLTTTTLDRTSTVSTDTTTTATETLAVPGPTTYAACADNNIASTANGGYSIGNTAIAGHLTFNYNYSPYDCCVACQTQDNCRGSVYIPGSDQGYGNVCFTDIGDQCLVNQFQGDVYYTYTNNNGGVVVSNGPCGVIGNGGNYPDGT